MMNVSTQYHMQLHISYSNQGLHNTSKSLWIFPEQNVPVYRVVQGRLWEFVLRFVLPMAVKAEDGAEWVDRFPNSSTLQAVANELSWWWQKQGQKATTLHVCSTNMSCWTAAKVQLVFLPYEGHYVAAWP